MNGWAFGPNDSLRFTDSCVTRAQQSVHLLEYYGTPSGKGTVTSLVAGLARQRRRAYKRTGRLSVTGSISSLRGARHAFCVRGAILCALAAFRGCRSVSSARLKPHVTYLIPFFQKAARGKFPFDFRGRDMSGLQSWE